MALISRVTNTGGTESNTPKSPWTPQETIVAAQAVLLATERHFNFLEPRLGNDFVPGLKGDVTTLQELHTGRTATTETMKGKTRELGQVLAEAHKFPVAARSAIEVHFPVRHAMRTNFGLNIKLNPTSMRAMLEALRMFIQAMEQYPSEAAAAVPHRG